MTGLGVPDAATVTPTGERLERKIDGVRTFAPINHVDHRGRVFEIYPAANDYWDEPFVYSYCFTVRAGATKGWGVHDHKHDRYTLITGEVLVVLFDGREDSPTTGLVQQVTLTGEGIRQITIPPGVWHLNVNLGESEAYLVNFPTKAYDHARPDRRTLPVDTPHIPFDARQVFPTQLR